MLSCVTVPDQLSGVLEAARGVFTAPSYANFTDLVHGLLSSAGHGAVTDMIAAAGLVGRRHWARYHRFFAAARWDPDRLGLALLGIVVALFAAQGELEVAVDDTLFHRCGKKIHAAFYQHDGSAKGRDGIGRGNCFVILAVLVPVPFMTRTVALPVLLRLNLGKGRDSKPVQAMEMIRLVAAAYPRRRIHVVADALYRGRVWRDLPAQLTFTTRLASNATLHRPAPPRTGMRGRPALKGAALPKLATMAARRKWHAVTVSCYGKAVEMEVIVVDCLSFTTLHTTPARCVIARATGSRRRYDIAVITTDLALDPAAVIARYSRRWAIEQTIKDLKDLLGVGQARNRVQPAVERTVPFQALCLTILFCWFHQHHDTSILQRARVTAPWYRHKTHVSVADMLTAYRHQPIMAVPAGQHATRQNPDIQLNALQPAA